MNEQDKLDRLPSVLPWVVGIAALLLLIAYVAAFHTLPTTESPPAWGAFGDYVGGVLNPLVSTFTLIVAVKVWRQQKIEMAETKKAVEEQAKTAEQQRQEQRFFDLLNIYFRTLESITSGYIRPIKRLVNKPSWDIEELGSEFVRLVGKAALRHELELIEDQGEGPDEINWTGYMTRYLDSKTTNRDEFLHELKLSWRSEMRTSWHHYFRTVTMVLTESERILGDGHKRYVNIFVDQLSEAELTLLAYYMLFDQEGQDLVSKAEAYALFRHIGTRKEWFQGVFPEKTFTREAESKDTRPPC